MAPMDENALKAWIGRSEEARDIAAPGPLAGLAALLDHPAPPWRAGALPPLGHWLYCHTHARQSMLGEDGHPRRGGDQLLPPSPLNRRMWAGGRIDFIAPIRLGAALTRRSTVTAINAKRGKAGALLFVTVRHEIDADGARCIEEEQDIVYRDGAIAAPASPEPMPAPTRTRQHCADAVALMRYSALTFNGHRIHYDRDYAIEVEGYPGLVVHGPYIATLLMDWYLQAHPRAAVRRFEFRARRPLFDGRPFSLNLAETPEGAQLWAAAAGAMAMTAQVSVA